MKPTCFMSVRSTLRLAFLLIVPLLFLQLHAAAKGGGSRICSFVYSEDKKPSEGANINVTNTSNGFTETTISDEKIILFYAICRWAPAPSR